MAITTKEISNRQASRSHRGTSHAIHVAGDNLFHGSPREIAMALKQSAEANPRRKSSPFRIAMATLTLYMNRAGNDLSEDERKKLELAKRELRALFGREPH